jgi:hypothetical protein
MNNTHALESKLIKRDKFIRMVGDVWLNGKSVQAYETNHPDFVMLCGRTTGDKRLKKTYEDFDGEEVTITIKDKVISRQEFEVEFNYPSLNALHDAFERIGFTDEDDSE